MLIPSFRPSVASPIQIQPHAVSATIGSVLLTPRNVTVATTAGVQLPAFFVSTTGLDSNAGTSEAAPFLTPAKARDAMRADATRNRVYIRGGTYSIGGAIALTSSDASTSWLAYPGETPILNGGGGLHSCFTLATSTNGVTFRGLKFINFINTADSAAAIIATAPVNNLTVVSCVFDNCGNGISKRDSSDGDRILGNTFTNSLRLCIFYEWFPNTNISIAGNSGTNLAGSLVQVAQSMSSSLIEYNEVDGSNNIGMFISSRRPGSASTNLNVQYNILKNCAKATSDSGALYFFGRPLTAVSSGGSVVPFVNSFARFNWVQTTGFASSLFGANIYLDDSTSGLNVFGNVIMNSIGGPAIHNHGAQNNVFQNNIILVREGASGQNFFAGDVPAFYQQPEEVFGPPAAQTTGMQYLNNIIVSVNSALSPVSYTATTAAQIWFWNDSAGAPAPTVDGNLHWQNMPATHSGGMSGQGSTSTETNFSTADPQFTSIPGLNFKLNAASPAYGLGFVDIANVTDRNAAGPPPTWGLGGYSEANYP